METYCSLCEKKTKDLDAQLIKGERWRIASKCKCGCKKSRSVPKGIIINGGGIVDTFIENNPIELHLPGRNDKTGKIQKSNFTGPGTKLGKRLDANDKPVAGSEPINKVDEGAYRHDLAYRDSTDAVVRNAADDVLKRVAEGVYNDSNESLANKIEAWTVIKAMNLIKRKV